MRERVLAAALLCLCFACDMPVQRTRPDVHGHRGCRGLMPENTIPAFIHAIDLGCDWLELDVVVNADSDVVVSHEPWMAARICLDRNGQAFEPAQERLLNIHRMGASDIALFDCGSKPDPRFPDRANVAATKPTLVAMVEACDEHAAENALPAPRYNIEIKSEPELYGEYQPLPARFAQLVVTAVRDLGIADRCLIQSFDPAVLNAVYALEPGITIALLVDNDRSLDHNLGSIGFRPAIYSPALRLVNEQLARQVAERDMELVVWTVNDSADMRRMIELGAEGIITDFPDRLIELLDR